jgi:hypothetical protein
VTAPVKVFDVSVLANGCVPDKGAEMPESVIQIKISPPVELDTLMELLLSNAGRVNSGETNPEELVVKFAPISPLTDASPGVPWDAEDPRKVTGPAKLLDQPMLIVSALAALMVIASPVATASTRPHLMTKVRNLGIFIW